MKKLCNLADSLLNDPKVDTSTSLEINFNNSLSSYYSHYFYSKKYHFVHLAHA